MGLFNPYQTIELFALFDLPGLVSYRHRLADRRLRFEVRFFLLLLPVERPFDPLLDVDCALASAGNPVVGPISWAASFLAFSLAILLLVK